MANNFNAAVQNTPNQAPAPVSAISGWGPDNSAVVNQPLGNNLAQNGAFDPSNPMSYSPTYQYNPLNANGTLISADTIPGADQLTNAAYAQNMLQTQNNTAQAQGQGAQAESNAEATAASMGGLDPAEQQALKNQANKATIGATQAVQGQNLANQASINTAGQQQQIGINQQNITNALNAGSAQNAFNLGVYNSQVAGAAANNQANATTQVANSGKK